MAHEIDTSTGKAAMAYQGDAPWHRLGTQVDPSASLDTWVTEAGFEWELKRATAGFQAEGGEFLELPNRDVLYRSDTQYPVGLVSDRYKIVQPRDVAEFFREFAEAGNLTMETMGVLNHGKKYWALARHGKGFHFGKATKDKVNPYVLLATSADGSMSTIAHLTSVRVVCQNTLQLAAGPQGKKAMIQIPHLLRFDPKRVKMELGLFPEAWERFEGEAKKMANHEVTEAEAIKFFLDLLAPNHDPVRDDDLEGILDPDWDPPERSGSSQEGYVSIAKVRNRIMTHMDVYRNGVGQEYKSTKGTVWGLVNAVTRFWDHDRPTRTDDSKLNDAWLGGGARWKQKAYQQALDLVNS